MSGEIKEECAVAAVSLPKPLEKYPHGGCCFLPVPHAAADAE